ncbi:MAG: 16S rRNA (guanine(527)-N(7))-methyltransferase RsmG [Ignavibacteria bacterium]
MSNENTENWQTLVREQQFNQLLIEWNSKINLVSRKKPNVFDLIEDSKIFMEGMDLTPGMNILDLGTGGGFPGIVLAIHHPDVNFVLVDSIQKKITVVSDIIKRMELTNARAICSRAEELAKADSPFLKGVEGGFANSFNYVVSRSVAVLQDLCLWSKDLIKPGAKLIALKGGDISGEIRKTRKLSFVKDVYRKVFDERILVIVEFF